MDEEEAADMAGSQTQRRTWSLADRLGAGCGAAYVLLVGVGNEMATTSGNDPHPSGKADLAAFSAVPTTAERVGFAMELVGMLTFVFFLGWFVSFLRGRGGAAAWLGTAAGIAGGVTLAVKLASVMPMTAGMLDHDELSATQARLLTDMNGAAFVVTFLTFGTFLLAGGLAILAGGALGRAAGWSAVAIGTACITVTALNGADPVTTNPVPFLLGLLWVLVTGIRLAVRPPRQSDVRSGEVAAPSALAPTA
jgi:hypothetical protein